MPAISMFYGIIVLMYYKDTKQHNLPHIHARYQGDEVVMDIENGDVLAGIVPNKQLRMLQAWIEIHKEELILDWQLALNGDEPFRIAPLQ